MNRNSKILNIFFAIIFILQINLINAQANKDNLIPKKEKDSEVEKSYFKFSSSYLTNAVYNGRQDSIVKPYIKPSISYVNKSGFSTSLTGYYLTLPNQNRFDYFSLDLDYTRNPIPNLTTGISANKAFYSNTSTDLRSAITGTLGASLGYDFGFMEVSAQGGVFFSEKKDLSLDIQFAHEFSVGEDDTKFSITPTFDIEMNSINYYDAYLNRKLHISKGIGKGKGKGQNSIPVTTSTSSSQVSVNKSKFSLMAYEASLPLSYEFNHFILFATPSFAIPQNPIHSTTQTTTTSSTGVVTITTTDTTPLSERNLKPLFYAEIGLSYKL